MGLAASQRKKVTAPAGWYRVKEGASRGEDPGYVSLVALPFLEVILSSSEVFTL